MFSGDRFEGGQRFAHTLVVDRGHSELILLTLVQPRDVTLRGATELTDRGPRTRLLVLLLYHVVTDRITAVILAAAVPDNMKFVVHKTI